MGRKQAKELPPPICPLGYPRHQVEEILEENAPKFWAWFAGQTGAICDGQQYDYELNVYIPTECAGNAHGPVIYASDLYEFVRYDGRVTSDW